MAGGTMVLDQFLSDITFIRSERERVAGLLDAANLEIQMADQALNEVGVPNINNTIVPLAERIRVLAQQREDLRTQLLTVMAAIENKP